MDIPDPNELCKMRKVPPRRTWKQWLEDREKERKAQRERNAKIKAARKAREAAIRDDWECRVGWYLGSVKNLMLENASRTGFVTTEEESVSSEDLQAMEEAARRLRRMRYKATVESWKDSGYDLDTVYASIHVSW